MAVIDLLEDRMADVAADTGGFSVVGDLADPASAVDATERAVDSLGGVDVFVNNAGILRFSPLLDITVDDWDMTFDVNVRAMLLTTQVAARA